MLTLNFSQNASTATPDYEVSPISSVANDAAITDYAELVFDILHSCCSQAFFYVSILLNLLVEARVKPHHDGHRALTSISVGHNPAHVDLTQLSAE